MYCFRATKNPKKAIPKSDARAWPGRLLIPLTQQKWALYRMAYIGAEKAPCFIPYQSQCMKNPAGLRDFYGVRCKPQNTGGTREIRTPGGLFSDFLLIFRHFIFSPTKARFASVSCRYFI